MDMLPEHVLRLMSDEDRAALGKPGRLASEAQVQWSKTEERKMHETVVQWLRLRAVPHVHARMDKRSTIQAGWPDITAVNQGRAALVELKAPGGTLSQDQRDCIAALTVAEVPVLVAFSAQDAIEFLRSELNIK